MSKIRTSQARQCDHKNNCQYSPSYKSPTLPTNVHKFYVDVYERTLYVCTGASREEMECHFKTSIEPHEMQHADAYCFKGRMLHHDRATVYVAYFEDDNAKTASTQAHESVHLASMIFRDLQITHYSYNEEPYAYLVGFIAGCINKTRA